MEINETDISTGHPLPTFDWARDKIHTEDNHQVHQQNARIQFHGNRQKVAAGRNEKKKFLHTGISDLARKKPFEDTDKLERKLEW